MKETANNYLPADEYFIIDDKDTDLTPIRISLPSPPPLHLIDGHDLPRDEQYFRRLVIPKRLEIIEKEVYERLRNEYNRNNNNSITVEKTIDLFWFLFEDRREDLKKEEEFIKKVHWYRTYGYWFFNDGKPTWIPPDYFDFLNFWTLQDGEKPEYRDKDRRKYCFWHYLKHATETFADLDKEGRAMKVDGKYTMIDVGARVFFGCAEPKTRRSGATQQGCHGIKKGIEDMFGGFGTIVSMDGDNAVVHFSKKLLNGLKEYPLFLKAKWDGNNTSNSVKYRARQNDPGNPSLNGSITYTESAGESKNDGDELHYFLSDEEGKCFSAGTQILMYDGSVKEVQNILVGDLVMGDDCSPRTVLNLTRGEGNMNQVVPNKWEGFQCNDNHILTCSVSDGHAFCGKKTGDVLDISVKDFLSLPYWKQKSLCLFKNSIYYHKKYNLELDPYFLGLWLGDGDHGSGRICNIDEEVINYLKGYAKEHGLGFRYEGGKTCCLYSDTRTKVVKYYGDEIVKSYDSAGDANKDNTAWAVIQQSKYNSKGIWFQKTRNKNICSVLKSIGVFKNKHIPEVYLKSSYEDRLQLLAGLIDTDGHARLLPKPVYEIIQKRKRLAYQIQELANSLGFYCSVTLKNATMWRKDGTLYECPVYRIKIHGEELYKVPCKIKRKKYEYYKNHNKSSRKSGFKIKPCGIGKYYGFQLDGNQKFLFPNGVVMHNCAVVQVDILERWNVNKKAQSKGLGSTIMGFCWHPSTVETMNAGGISYRKLIDMSNFYQRIEGKGQTFSGLAMCFFSATDGAENFIDRFGMSVINKPTERQIALRPDALFARMKMGSYDYMMKERNRLLSDGSPAALELYRSMRRKEPMSFAECWIGTAGDMGFNLEKIDQRMIELNRRSKIRKGNLKWKGGIPDSEVIFVDDENGRWEFSFLPDESARNLKTKVRVYNSRTAKYEWQWKGLNWNIFTIGVDPFGYTNKAESKLRDDNSRQSNGGLACLRSRDLETDKSDDPNTWKTRRFICSYSHRPPSTYDFNEDVLMTAVFTGGSVYLERNRENTWQHLIERGYGGFLQYDLDMSTGRPKDKPGAYASETNKDELFSEIKDYIEYHCHIEEHASFLTEVKNIRGKEEMTKFDRFTAHGWALIGDKRKTGGLYRKKEEPKGRMPSMTSIVNALLR